MFEKYSLLSNFAQARRLHLSFLLPGVLIYAVLLNATINSVYAQAPDYVAPTNGTVVTPVSGASTSNTNLLSQPAVPGNNDVITWSGDVEFKYEPQKITATAEKAEYYKLEQKVVLTGKVKIVRAGQPYEAETATFFVTNEFKMTADKVAMPEQ
ncbi:MAG: LPS export ABC transporter periplasmic protein LptC [Calothrix sp. FI2-JRJ7]|jgi:lipopolysaccharide assembly outer membrane protein LptD (OstA)|nr:LPS export ABC transporter periplasmic protein LptC [Calothrix sp. FI2-JRJ7]